MQLQTFIHNFEGFLAGVFRVNTADKVGFTEQKSKSFNFVQGPLQRVIGVNREVRIRGCAHVAPLGLGWVTSSLVHLIDDLYTLRSSGARE